MQKEQEQGPIAVWNKNAPEEEYEENETNTRLNDYKVRKYELDRLKYYYSIIEFDSGKTADIVFSQCNGIELENTGIKIDLRAVPDELQIPGPIQDECVEKPNKSSDLNFVNRSKQHTNVKVTWEEEEKGNKNSFLFEGDDNIFDGNKVDLHEIIASEDLESDEDEDEEQDVNALRSKLLGKQQQSSDDEDAESEEEKSKKNVYADFDKKNRHKGVEVSFLQAFQDEDSSSDEEDKQKIQFSHKNRRDIVRRNSDEEEENEQLEVDEDEFFNVEDQDGDGEGLAGKDKKQSKRDQFRQKLKDEKKAKRAQEQDKKKGYKDKRQSANELANLELLSKRQPKSGEDFALDMEDDRFGRFKNDPSMAIDPTVPDYDPEKSKGLLEFKKNYRSGQRAHEHGGKKLKLR